MGILHTIEDATLRQMYSGFLAEFVTRGLALPLDKFASGLVRFGKKIEFVLPFITQDNKFTLAQDAIFDMDRIVVDRPPTWISPGGYIYVGQQELHKVDDVSYTTIILASGLLADQPLGQPVYHYSEPIKVEGGYAIGNDVINIDTEYFIVRGDVIAISASKDLDVSFREYKVTDLVLTSTIAGINQYQVVLDKGIHRDLEDEEIIQLRAYLGYKSKIMELPTDKDRVLFFSGPFLVDWWSSAFIRDSPLSEVQTLYRYNTTHDLISQPEIIEKNFQLLTSIEANQFLFWDKVDGGIGYDDDTKRLMIKVNSEGKWWLKHTCAPKMKVPFTYATGSIVTPAPTEFVNNDWFRIYDGSDARVFEYAVNGAYVPTPQAAASGTITVGGPALPSNNMYFFLDGGFGKSMYFEYKADATTYTQTPSYYPIDITTEIFPVEVAIKTIEAINKVKIGITASLDLSTMPIIKIALVNDKISLNGNQAIILGPGFPAGWGVLGMSGGTDMVETIDISAVTVTTAPQVAALTSAAINRSNIDVTATLPGIFNSFKLISKLQGTLGNFPITENVATPLFIVTGMSGGTGGISWHFNIKSEQDALMRVRLYPNDWLPDVNLAAGVDTVVVVNLNPTDLDVERIDLLAKVKAGSNGEIEMGAWTVSTQEVAALSHEYVSQMYGDYTMASTTLWAKPLFPCKEDLRVKLDSGIKLDSGAFWI